MEEFREVYVTFMNDVASINVKDKPSSIVNEIGNLMTFVATDGFVKGVVSKNRVKTFVSAVDKIYTSIKKKKKFAISDIDGFESFCRVAALKESDVMNFFDADDFNVNLFKIADNLKTDDNTDENYQEFFNYFLLLYIHAVEYLYPDVRNCDCKASAAEDENAVPEKTLSNFKLVLETFEEKMFDSESLGHNIMDIVKTLFDNLSGKLSSDMESKLKKVVSNEAIPGLIFDIVNCFMSEEDINNINEDVKKIRKEDIAKYVEIAEKKVSSINVLDILKKINNTSSITDIASIGKNMGIDISSILSALN